MCMPAPAIWSEPLPLAEAVRVGLFDGAAVELDRLFAPPQAAGSGALDTSLGVLLWFYGRVAECEVGRSRITIRVKSLINLLAVQQMPRRLYQASCSHVFGDTMCGYDRVLGENAAGASTGIGAVTIAALAGSTQAQIATSFHPSPATAYDEGTITALSGANSRRDANHHRSLTGGDLYHAEALALAGVGRRHVPAAAGLRSHHPTCKRVLQNIARYGGFPYVPPPESAA